MYEFLIIIRMYRLTISGPFVDKLRDEMKTKQTTWLRMYRWGSTWGVFTKEHDDWVCERRTFLSSMEDNGNTYIVESVHNVDCSAPPYDIDDMWEEEVIKKDNVACGNLYTITGSGKELHAAAKEYPVIAKWLVEHVAQTNVVQPAKVVNHERKVFKTRAPVCLIENY